jgi:hypothetical protein
MKDMRLMLLWNDAHSFHLLPPFNSMTVSSDEDTDLVGNPFLSRSDGSPEASHHKPMPRKHYEPGNTPTEKAVKVAKMKRKTRKDMIADLVAKPAKKSKKGTTSHTRAVNFLPDEDEVIAKAYCTASHVIPCASPKSAEHSEFQVITAHAEPLRKSTHFLHQYTSPLYKQHYHLSFSTKKGSIFSRNTVVYIDVAPRLLVHHIIT